MGDKRDIDTERVIREGRTSDYHLTSYTSLKRCCALLKVHGLCGREFDTLEIAEYKKSTRLCVYRTVACLNIYM